MTPVPETDGDVAEGTAQRALLAATGSQVLQPDPGSMQGSLVDRSRVGERQRYVLQERIAEMEMRLRERAGLDDVRELELRSMQHEVDLKSAYIAQLEAAQHGLRLQLNERNEHEAVLSARLAEVQREAAELGALVTAMRRRKAYRLLEMLSVLARPVRVPLSYARRALRRLRRG